MKPKTIVTLIGILFLLSLSVLAQEHKEKKWRWEQKVEIEGGYSNRAPENPEVEQLFSYLAKTRKGEKKIGLGLYGQYMHVNALVNQASFGVGPTFDLFGEKLQAGIFPGLNTKGQAFIAGEVETKFWNRKLAYMPEVAFGKEKPTTVHQRFKFQIWKYIYFHADSLRAGKLEEKHGEKEWEVEHSSRYGAEVHFRIPGLNGWKGFVNPDITNKGKPGITFGFTKTFGSTEH